MGYKWGTILFIMGYFLGVHSLPLEIEEFVENVPETKILV
jgi:hypothetical protein